MADFDLVIAGSGFGGSLLAMIACRLGLRVLLAERHTHPRFAIGESSSPLANVLLEELARRYDLPRLLPLTAWGSWQRIYPYIACGLKRGFTFYHHEAGQRFANTPERTDQLLVAASPSDELSDTHWFRADFDYFLMREAVAAGAEYGDRLDLAEVRWDGAIGRIAGIRRTQRGRIPFSCSTRLVVDASGPRGFLFRALGLEWKLPPGMPSTSALYTHFVDVERCEALPDYATRAAPPYPPDDAALHHVFAGGWMWVLRFNNGITSAGVAMEQPLAAELGLAEGPSAWRRVLRRFPSIEQQFGRAEPVQPFVFVPVLPFRVEQAAGPGWALLPSAAAFVDPLFSTGIPLTLLGIQRLAAILERAGATPSPELLEGYSASVLEDADFTARFIGACYRTMAPFSLFPSLSMIYFAAASFSEAARRLGYPLAPKRFLAADVPGFCEAADRILQRILDGDPQCPSEEFAGEVCRAIAPINVAGLCDPARKNWYPVDLDDLVRNAENLGTTPEEMRRILANADWARI
ncbi:MAG: NAD(P)/FAD-dependent oxidoreductase [Chthonomonadales bacterium]